MLFQITYKMPGQIEVTEVTDKRDIALAIVKKAMLLKGYDIAVKEFSES
tara:strand:+ start:1268 stop:1414 length:147 start_codon:yes stop_codon:yes gene_type:complete